MRRPAIIYYYRPRREADHASRGDRAAAMTGMELKRMRLAFLGGAMIALCYMLATEDDD